MSDFQFIVFIVHKPSFVCCIDIYSRFNVGSVQLQSTFQESEIKRGDVVLLINLLAPPSAVVARCRGVIGSERRAWVDGEMRVMIPEESKISHK